MNTNRTLVTGMNDTIHRDALQTLATGLAYGTVPEGTGFDMGRFAQGPHCGDDKRTDCGTVGCAVGHGPYFGFDKSPDEDWESYADRVFIDYKSYESAWAWCFSGAWAPIDNTRLGAAKRIQYFLDNGLPKDWSGEPYIRFTDLYRDIVVKVVDSSAFFRELQNPDADPSLLSELSRDVTDEQVEEYREKQERAERAAYAKFSF